MDLMQQKIAELEARIKRLEEAALFYTPPKGPGFTPGTLPEWPNYMLDAFRPTASNPAHGQAYGQCVQ